MSMTINAHDYREWEELGLLDYSDYSDKIQECNQWEQGDCTVGEWYYIPSERTAKNDAVIYFGSWGNYNAPGASSYTYAEVYDMDNPDEVDQYAADVKRWKRYPEWV